MQIKSYEGKPLGGGSARPPLVTEGLRLHGFPVIAEKNRSHVFFS